MVSVDLSKRRSDIPIATDIQVITETLITETLITETFCTAQFQKVL